MLYIPSWAWYVPPKNLFELFAYDCRAPKRAGNTYSTIQNVSLVTSMLPLGSSC